MAYGRAILKVFDSFKRHRERIVLGCVITLVGALSFEAGMLEGEPAAAAPIVIEKPVGDFIPVCADSGQVAGAASTAAEPVPATPGRKDCTFVGSKNSTLYHLPTCAVAKRIKPGNIVCFASKEDAEKRGYKPGCLK